MTTFFYVTEILFDLIKETFEGLFSWFSTIAGALALVFLVVILVTLFTKGINKKFFVNNKKFLIVTLALEVLSSMLNSDINFIKINLLIICLCLFIILYKSTKKINKRDSRIVDVKVKRKKIK